MYKESLFICLWFLFVSMALSGCASGRVHPSPVGLKDFIKPAVGADQKLFRGTDGKELAYFHYRGDSIPDTALVYLHGIESHAGWFDSASQKLSELGYDVFCLDRRGSGINRENRDFPSGHIDSYSTFIKDINQFIPLLEGQFERTYLIGLSWGGKLAVGYALLYPQNIDGLVLITPGIHSNVDVSLKEKTEIFVLTFVKPTSAIPIPIEDEMFTRSERSLNYIRNDPLRLHTATARFFYESWKLERFIRKNFHRNQLPILLFLAEHDRIVDNYEILETLRTGNQKDLSIQWYEDQTHSIQFDATERMVSDIHQWISGRRLHRDRGEENQ